MATTVSMPDLPSFRVVAPMEGIKPDDLKMPAHPSLMFVRPIDGRRSIYRCSCGVEKEVQNKHVVSGHTKSCGCHRREMCRQTKTKHGHTVGRAYTPIYQTYRRMIRRCTEKTNPKYPDYGGRGIMVCDRWMGPEGFVNFIADMGPCPAPNYSIDRYPDNNGNYEPGNCRWATSTEQARNRRTSHLIVYEGQTKCLQEWANELGVSYWTLRRKIAAFGVVAAITLFSKKEGM